MYNNTRIISDNLMSNSSYNSSYNLYNADPTIFSFILNYADSSVHEWTNGNANTINQPAIKLSFNDIYENFYIGTGGDHNTSFHGIIYEVIVYNTAVSITERQLIEGYMAWKWGLQASLPSNHPYYASSPQHDILITTGPSQPTGLSVSNITKTEFTVNWSGGVNALSYTYTLNGLIVKPSIDNGISSKNVIFTELTAETLYTICVIAHNNNGSTSSAGYSITTL
jgi:hypothetical protein